MSGITARPFVIDQYGPMRYVDAPLLASLPAVPPSMALDAAVQPA